MSLGFHPQISSQSNRQRVGALTVFSLAGLLVGLGASVAAAQNAPQPSANASDLASMSSSTSRPANQQANIGKPMMTKIGKDVAMEFQIEHPTWRESKAVRVVDPNRPETNIELTLYAQLVVGVENEQVLKNAIATVATQLGSNRPGSHTFRPFLNQPNVFVVQANSVEDAINLSNELTRLGGIEWAEIDFKDQVVEYAITTDPLAPFQWHVSNTAFPGTPNDHKIDKVYDLGYTGSGVVVGILEAFENSFFHVDEFGTQFIHPDLANKLNMALSVGTAPFDVEYSHGVSVAGLVASEGNNGIAGAGVAYGAQLASLNNSSGIAQGESFGHELDNIDIINNSWGPASGAVPQSGTGKVLIAAPDDYEITIPIVGHRALARTSQIGIDQGIRLGRGRKGRIFVFSSGNSSYFQGFARLGTGNAISLPGIGIDPMVAPYGYLDITTPDQSQTDADGNGIPDVFNIDGTISAGWRWSGLMGYRNEYNEMASRTRTFAIASIGMSNARSGYSTTGCSILAGAYSQDSILAQEFTPGMSWFPSVSGEGLVTLSQLPDDPFGCNALYTTGAFSGTSTSCQFNGTSAAAPVAAGIFALMLEANPSLTLRDVQHIVQETSTVVNFDPTESYWPSVLLGLGTTDNDNPGPPVPTFWTTNDAGIRHSDEYGFGILDAEAAVTMAATYPGAGQLFLLDSGMVNEGDPGFFQDGKIADAAFQQVAVISENLETNTLVPGVRNFFNLNCVRDNIIIEGVEIDLTITGDGAGDLLIALQSPRGTISPLALPRADSNGLSGTAYNNYTFSTYKDWGELSGGQWTLVIQDFRPDADSPEGNAPTDPMPAMPSQSDFGLEQVTFLGTFGLPGNPNHTDKTLVSYRLKIFGTNSGLPVFEGCNPLTTSCPGDLDGNGIVNITDLQIYIQWFIESNPLADLDFDGDVDFADLIIFRGLWTPGFCNRLNDPFAGGRPRPGGSGISGDNDPIVRPI